MSVYFDQFLTIAPALVPLMIVMIAFAFHFLPAEITDHIARSIGRFIGRFLIGPLAAFMAPVAALIARFAAIALLICGMVLSTIVLAGLFSTSCAELKTANDDQVLTSEAHKTQTDAAKQVETLKLKRYELAYRLYLAHAEQTRQQDAGPIPLAATWEFKRMYELRDRINDLTVQVRVLDVQLEKLGFKQQPLELLGSKTLELRALELELLEPESPAIQPSGKSYPKKR